MDDTIIPARQLQARRHDNALTTRKTAVALDRPFVTPDADRYVYQRGMNEGAFLQLLQAHLPKQAGVRITARRHDIEIWLPPHFSQMYQTMLLETMQKEFGQDMVQYHNDHRACVFTLSNQILRDEWGLEGFALALTEGKLANLVPLPKVHAEDVELLAAKTSKKEQSF